MDIIKWSEPREAVETIATFGIEERGEPLELDGASADLLCDGVAELLAENVKLRTELAKLNDKLAHETNIGKFQLQEITELRAKLTETENAQ